MCNGAQVEFRSVEPKVYDEGAEVHNQVVQLTTARTTFRYVWHGMQLLVTCSRRVLLARFVSTEHADSYFGRAFAVQGSAHTVRKLLTRWMR